ncbi:MFS transporter [Chitinolyticbacter meiyuanensis]|uniref:MFS transporter n=1 Tax=Chitinolyticbacter meiyuanensis TaxID=682798 RepID=UPI0011E5C943|nr:MFS transporter [Chitinolyticbacter meiyuanensis]
MTSRQNAILLGLCQFCYMAATAVGISFAGLVGARLAPDPAWATVPYLLITVSTTVATLWLPRLIGRHGYRRLFASGALAGAASGTISVLALHAGSFWLFCLASPLQGCYQASALYYRYAAAETASDRDKGSAMAWVLSGGIFAAFAGPLLASHAATAVPGVPYAGSFAAVIAIALLALLPIMVARLPSPPTASGLDRLNLAAALRAPGAKAGMLACAGGYALMMFLMVATPLAVTGCGFGHAAAASVIQWHMLGMFAPSLVTGRLIARFGAGRVAAAGGVLMLLACLLALAGLTLLHFHLSLTLVGLAWNLMYMGGSTLVSQTSPAARARLQSANEFLTFGCTAVAAGLAGWVYQVQGWYAVAQWAMVLLALMAVFAGWLGWRSRVVYAG